MKVKRGQDGIQIEPGHTVVGAHVIVDGMAVQSVVLSRRYFAEFVHRATEKNKGRPIYGIPTALAQFDDSIALHPLPDQEYEIRLTLQPPTVQI